MQVYFVCVRACLCVPVCVFATAQQNYPKME